MLRRAAYFIPVLLALVLSTYTGLVALSWYTGDAITRAHIETIWLLRSHSLVDRSSAVRAWLNRYHGEAPSSEVMNVFVAWSIAHPCRAAEVVAPMAADESAILAARVAWAAVDTGQDQELVDIFEQSTSVVFASAIDRIARRDFHP